MLLATEAPLGPALRIIIKMIHNTGCQNDSLSDGGQIKIAGEVDPFATVSGPCESTKGFWYALAYKLGFEFLKVFAHDKYTGSVLHAYSGQAAIPSRATRRVATRQMPQAYPPQRESVQCGCGSAFMTWRPMPYTALPHSGHFSGVARRSYPQLAQCPAAVRRRCRQPTPAHSPVGSSKTAITAQVGQIASVRLGIGLLPEKPPYKIPKSFHSLLTLALCI
jgi:hypothetical protein